MCISRVLLPIIVSVTALFLTSGNCDAAEVKVSMPWTKKCETILRSPTQFCSTETIFHVDVATHRGDWQIAVGRLLDIPQRQIVLMPLFKHGYKGSMNPKTQEWETGSGMLRKDGTTDLTFQVDANSPVGAILCGVNICWLVSDALIKQMEEGKNVKIRITTSAGPLEVTVPLFGFRSALIE